MATIATRVDEVGDPVVRTYAGGDGTASSGVSWAAIFAGAAAAASLSLILLVLGAGLGLTAVSPWAQKGVSANAFGLSAILWISFTALVASGLGGYLAGRLRVKWATLHTDEVYFRDTAHGFLAWAVATLLTAGLLTSAITSVIGMGATAVGGAAAVGGTAATAMATGAMSQGASPEGRMPGPDRAMPSPYLMDSLFRGTPTASGANAASSPSDAGGRGDNGGGGAAGPKGEVGRIFANALRNGTLPADDMHYAAQLVAQRTGMSQADAEKRVTDAYNGTQAKLRAAESDAKEAAEQARRSAAFASLWIFVSLLLGAFSASLMATYGGRQRDHF